MAIEALPKIWDKLPTSIRSGVSGSYLHRFLQRQVAYREPLVELQITPTDKFTFKIVVPERLSPYWLDYDPTVEHSCHEPITTRTFINEISTEDVVWDLGSQWGYFGVLAANLNGSPSDVHIFDMEPYHCLQIERTSDVLFDGDGINIIETQISDTPGQNQMTGDQYRSKTESPDFVKVDIEGAEVAAVSGMRKTIENDAPTLIIEVHPNKIAQFFDEDVEEFLSYLQDEYDVLKICDDFRKIDSEWYDFKFDTVPKPGNKGMDGLVDQDSYQILCQ
jgi:hypothetical protein